MWSEKPEQIIVADNSHPRFTWGDLAGSDIPVTIFPSPGNRGYGQAANLAISTVNREIPYVLLLTQDCRLEPSTAGILLDTIRSDPYAMVAGLASVYRSKPDKYFSLGGTLSHR